ncbi:cysteine-type peptidase [Raphanus sativus]|nr:cysteine-type peptidase [Raphanus sativus]
MVVDRETRLKYGCLSLLASVILSTTHSPRISQECAEMIKDFQAVFAYPWERVSFDMLMSSIKKRKEVSLSQNTIALKEFVLALQLVIVKCVHALTEVVQEGSSSGSDGGTVGDDDTLEIDK